MVSTADIIALVGICLFAGLISIASHRVARTKGLVKRNHAIFLVVATLLVVFLPGDAKETIFSPLAVVIVGTVLPIYESLRAVSTFGSDDDTVWLQYWIAQAALSFSTEWIDGFEESFAQPWHEFEFFSMLWLLLPWTDGAQLLFDYFTEPVLSPIVQPMVEKCDGWINKIALTFVNSVHIWFVWFAFVFLDPTLKRIIWICIAVLFPLGASLVAVTTPEGADDTYWLTYWSCFGILFLIIDFLENFLGFIPFFYTAAILATMYLMLPLFRGAELVFRNILVPIAGLQKELIKRDAETVKADIISQIPEGDREQFMKEISEQFANSENLSITKKGSTKVDTNYQAIV